MYLVMLLCHYFHDKCSQLEHQSANMAGVCTIALHLAQYAKRGEVYSYTSTQQGRVAIFLWHIMNCGDDTPSSSPCSIKQAALDISMLLFASDVSISARRKSAHVTAETGSSTRHRVVPKNRRNGRSKTLAGSSRSMASRL